MAHIAGPSENSSRAITDSIGEKVSPNLSKEFIENLPWKSPDYEKLARHFKLKKEPSIFFFKNTKPQKNKSQKISRTEFRDMLKSEVLKRGTFPIGFSYNGKRRNALVGKQEDIGEKMIFTRVMNDPDKDYAKFSFSKMKGVVRFCGKEYELA